MKRGGGASPRSAALELRSFSGPRRELARPDGRSALGLLTRALSAPAPTRPPKVSRPTQPPASDRARPPEALSFSTAAAPQRPGGRVPGREVRIGRHRRASAAAGSGRYRTTSLVPRALPPAAAHRSCCNSRRGLLPPPHAPHSLLAGPRHAAAPGDLAGFGRHAALWRAAQPVHLRDHVGRVAAGAAVWRARLKGAPRRACLPARP